MISPFRWINPPHLPFPYFYYLLLDHLQSHLPPEVHQGLIYTVCPPSSVNQLQHQSMLSSVGGVSRFIRSIKPSSAQIKGQHHRAGLILQQGHTLGRKRL